MQTVFDSLAKNTQQQFFAYCIVILRVVLGITCLSFVGEFWGAKVFFVGWPLLATAALLFGGVALIFGLLVRPASLVLSIFVLCFAYLTWGDVLVERNASHVLLVLGLLALHGLFAAGGSGHALGFDGIILRNIRRPGRWSKFLFG